MRAIALLATMVALAHAGLRGPAPSSTKTSYRQQPGRSLGSDTSFDQLPELPGVHSAGAGLDIVTLESRGGLFAATYENSANQKFLEQDGPTYRFPDNIGDVSTNSLATGEFAAKTHSTVGAYATAVTKSLAESAGVSVSAGAEGGLWSGSASVGVAGSQSSTVQKSMQQDRQQNSTVITLEYRTDQYTWSLNNNDLVLKDGVLAAMGALPTCNFSAAVVVVAPTTSSSSEEEASSCDVCTDEPANWMVDNGKACATWTWGLENRCNQYASWVEGKYCQQSCFDAGHGYDGDNCCTSDVAASSSSTSDQLAPCTTEEEKTAAKAAYRSFILSYGTHYATSGTMGGSYEFAYTFDAQDVATMSSNGQDAASCLEVDASVSVGYGGASGGVSASHKECTEALYGADSSRSFTSAHTNVEAHVRGGLMGEAGHMVYLDGSADGASADAWEAWVDSVPKNPAMLYGTLAPIDELFERQEKITADQRATVGADPETWDAKKTLMQAALEEYYEEHSLLGADECPSSCADGQTKYVYVDAGKATCACDRPVGQCSTPGGIDGDGRPSDSFLSTVRDTCLPNGLIVDPSDGRYAECEALSTLLNLYDTGGCESQVTEDRCAAAKGCQWA